MGDNDASTKPEVNAASREAKRAVRRTLRAARRARRDMGETSEREADGRRLLRLAEPALRTASCVATFEPLDTESNLEPINARLLENGRVIVPITLEDLDLSWRDLATGEDLGKDAIALADVVVAPALAIGARGERLGQGGGCYDRALPRRREGTPVIAVVFPDEFGVDFPTQAHDERVDAVLTVNGLTWLREPLR